MLVFSSIGIYLYYKSETILAKSNLSAFNKRTISLFSIFFCFYMVIMPFYPCFNNFYTFKGFLLSSYYHILRSSFFVLLPVFSIMHIKRFLEIRNVPLAKQQVTIITAIFIFLISTNVWMRLLIGDANATNTIDYTFLVSLFLSGVVSALYLGISYAELSQKKLQFEKELEISKLSELKIKAELEALEAKINPHFLYNTLNSIAELSVSQGLKARNMTIALADLFRYSLNKNNELKTTIEQEIEMVKNYLMIEEIRFEEKLEVSIIVNPSVKRALIPKFILQPIVENAVKHGLKQPGKKGFIEINIRRDHKLIWIAIRDSGFFFPEDIQIGYGLKNIMDKLAYLYPGKHSISFENEPRKQVIISIENSL